MKPKAFTMADSKLAAQIALVEGSAMIAGHDPITGKDYAIAMTRFYVDRTVMPDGWPLAGETQDDASKE